MRQASPPALDPLVRRIATERDAWRCVGCDRLLWVRPLDEPCRGCRRAASPRPAVALTRPDAVRYGTRLRRGLDLIAVSLLLIPVTPGVLMLTAAMGSGDDRRIRVGLLVLLEHGLWLVGVRVATEFAITQPATRGAARRARWATSVDACAAMLFVLSLVLATRFENDLVHGCLFVCLAAALMARGVALWSGTGAIAAVLRALGSGRIALGLRLLAALACGVAVVAAAGLALVLYADGGGVTAEARTGLRESGYLLLVLGLPALWCVALAAGGLCTFATVRLNHRFGRVAAALR